MASDRAREAAIAASIAITIAVAPVARAETQEARAEAQRLFEAGLALLDAGDRERALDHFLRSRALVPGKGNTANAAHCLHELGRYDEALELYEELVARFANDLSADNKQRLVPAMRSLLARVGSVLVTANVEGTVLVDGRPRGKTPLRGPVRVLGGEHVVRVIKDGYVTFERAVSVAVGATVSLDATLSPLREAGQLRLEDPTNEGADVFVDRVRVGSIPWEGTLGPGDHLVWITGKERGTAPTKATVVQGQLATLRLVSAPLGAITGVVAEPTTAEIRIDGVTLGKGSWEGRLPLGDHEISASEPGYLTRSRAFTVTPRAASTRLTIALDIDAPHPRWPKPRAPTVRVDVIAAMPFGPGLASDVAQAGVASGLDATTGGLVGARVGVRFASGLALELTGGYLTLGTRASRTLRGTFPSAGEAIDVTYHLDHALRWQGAFLGAGVALQRPLSPRFALHPRLVAGVVVASVGAPITGDVATSQESTQLTVVGRSERVMVTPFVLEPSLDIEARWGGLHVGTGLGVMFVMGNSPSLGEARVVGARASCTAERPASPGCAPAFTLPSARVFRPFALPLPSFFAGYDF